MQKSESNTVKRTLDLKNRPAPGIGQLERLAAVAAMPDDRIDYSDAPYLSDAVWTKAVEVPSAKKQVTLRIDVDVLDFFKGTGSRYQTRINAVLRAYAKAHAQ